MLRRVAGIQMHVDIHVELARQREDAVDLAGVIGIVVRRGTHHLGAAPQRLDDKLLGPGIVGQPLLRENA